MSVTIKEIARLTGLSVPTVGNVLGRSAARYSAETRRRVREAAQELGYRPNSSARAMRQGRTGCAALVLSRSRQQTHSYIPAGLLDGLDDELALHNMHLTVSRLSDEELSSDDFVPKVLREHMADGMIVNYTHGIPPTMLDLIHAHHTPAVWLNAKLKEDCAYPDDEGAARSVTSELLKLGHRRIALVHLVSRLNLTGAFAENKAQMHYSALDRAAGYAAVMLDAGLQPQVLSHERYIEQPEHMESCRALLSGAGGAKRPTAVLAYSEPEAMSLIVAARSLGLEIPRDLTIAVFAPVGMWIGGFLMSAAAIPTQEMGRRAVQMLLRKLQEPDVVCAPEPIPYTLAGGGTVAALKTE
jgi:LacI family transcriptional regulator